ncbi:MAG: hypothetical protein ACTSO9_04075 [Candidatus Helarchaeota archaeon]
MADRLSYKWDYDIAATNNSFRSVWNWYADTVFTITRLLNTTSNTWSLMFGGTIYLSGYNSTNASAGFHFRTSTLNVWWPVIPLNLSAANKTVVYNTISYMNILRGPSGSCGHSSPSSLPGTWAIWNGSGDNDNSWKVTYIYNSRGILTKMSWYGSGTSWGDWRLRCGWALEMQEFRVGLLLLAAIPQKSFLDALLDPFILIILAMGAVILILIVVLVKKE